MEEDKLKTKSIKYFDNGGTTFDRYTVIIGDSVFGFSSNPFSPQGFNQYCGEGSEVLPDNLGKELSWNDLPFEVKKAVLGRIV